MARERSITVKVLGDADSLERALKKAGNATDQAGSRWGKAGRAAGILGKAAGGLGLVLGAGVAAAAAVGAKGLIDEERAMAKVTAAVKSTGGASKVTAKEIDKFAVALQAKAGIDADATRTSGALLLSFTRIRNEAGKGNQVFTEAQKAIADLSVGMGVDMKAATVQVGKALNDPIKGVTALSKAGVQFTAQQKEQIATLVESGRTLDAQKIILGELNTQFGGQAAAFGETTAGKIERVKLAWGEVAEAGAKALLPVLTGLADVMLTKVIPAVEVMVARGQVIAAEWGPRVSAAFEMIRAGAAVAFDWIRVNIGPYVGEMAATVRSIVGNLQRFWRTFGDEIVSYASAAFGLLKIYIGGALTQLGATIKLVMAVIRGDWGEAWKQIKTLATNPISTLGAALKQIITQILPAIAGVLGQLGTSIASKIWQGIQDGPLGQFAGFVRAKVIDPVSGMLDRIGQLGTSIGTRLMNGLKGAVEALVNAPANAFIRGVNRMTKVVSDAIPFVSIPAIPQLAQGAVVERATLAVVGEDGPEAVIPLGRKRRKRGVELLTAAARAMNLPGDFPGPPSGIRMLGLGGIFAPVSQVARLDEAVVGGLKGAGSAAFDQIAGIARAGAAAVIAKIPTPSIGMEPFDQLLAGIRDTIIAGIRGAFERSDEWSFGKIGEAAEWMKAQMGKPYLWGGGHGGFSPLTLPAYDCSGFTSRAAYLAGARISAPGTTMTLFPASKPVGGDAPFAFGFRGMQSSDPRRQHMGAKALGTWYQFADPGRSGGTDAQWDHLRTLPGLPGYVNGTPYVPATGPALLHRGEAVVDAQSAADMRARPPSPALVVEGDLVVNDRLHAEILAGTIGRRLAGMPG